MSTAARLLNQTALTDSPALSGLTIVGLGPGDRNLRTLGTQAALDSARRIIVRTGINPGIDDLLSDPRVSTCDDLYEHGESFDAVYAAIVERVVEAATVGNVVYAVPGHPLFGERTIAPIRAVCKEREIPVSVLPAVSALDVVALAVDRDLLAEQVQIVDALEIDAWHRREPFGGGLLDLVPTRPLVVGQVYSRAVASSTKLALARLYPEDHLVDVVVAAGVPTDQSVTRCPLYELDRLPVDHLTTLVVPPLPELAASRSAATLHRIAARLRAPDGCPWDRKQTHRSLRGAAIEEVYEVVDAIDEGDAEHLTEELGDLLLQVALHAQIAEESGDFTIEDVYHAVNRKLVRRHPHVFGEADAETPDDVVKTWERVKADERRERGESTERTQSPFDQLPRAMPVMTRIAQLQDRLGDGSRLSTDGPGERLLAAVMATIAAGLDPERELERAYRAHATKET